jgi:hypothetical protein
MYFFVSPTCTGPGRNLTNVVIIVQSHLFLSIMQMKFHRCYLQITHVAVLRGSIILER